jgi:hypothetical protein
MSPTGRLTGRLVGLEQREKPRERAHAKYFQAKADCVGVTKHELMHAIPDLVRFAYVHDHDGYAEGLAADTAYFGSVYLGGCESVVRRLLWNEPESTGAVTVWREPSAGRLFEVQHHTEASWQAMQATDPLYVELRDPSTTPAGRLNLHLRLREIAAAVPTPPGVPLRQPEVEALPEAPTTEQTAHYKLLLLGRDPTAPVGLLRRRVWLGGMADETLRDDLSWAYSPTLTGYSRGDAYLLPRRLDAIESRILLDLFTAYRKAARTEPGQ